MNGLVSLPVPLPFMDYGKARAARDRLLARIRAVIAERRRRPASDALSRRLHRRGTRRPCIHRRRGRPRGPPRRHRRLHRLRAHGGGDAPDGAAAGPAPALQRRGRGQRCERAVRRWQRSIRSRQRWTWCERRADRADPRAGRVSAAPRAPSSARGSRVPENWRVHLALWLNSHDPAIYRDPGDFRSRLLRAPAEPSTWPTRSPSSPRALDPPDSHRCLGLDYSTYLALAFITLLLRDYLNRSCRTGPLVELAQAAARAARRVTGGVAATADGFEIAQVCRSGVPDDSPFFLRFRRTSPNSRNENFRWRSPAMAYRSPPFVLRPPTPGFSGLSASDLRELSAGLPVGSSFENLRTNGNDALSITWMRYPAGSSSAGRNRSIASSPRRTASSRRRKRPPTISVRPSACVSASGAAKACSSVTP